MKKAFFLGMLCALMSSFSYGQSFKPSPADVPVPAGPLLITEDESVPITTRRPYLPPAQNNAVSNTFNIAGAQSQPCEVSPLGARPTQPMQATTYTGGGVNNGVNNTVNLYMTTPAAKEGGKKYVNQNCCLGHLRQRSEKQADSSLYWKGRHDGLRDSVLKGVNSKISTGYWTDKWEALLILGSILVVGIFALLFLLLTRQQSPPVTVHVPTTSPVAPAVFPPSRGEIKEAMESAKNTGSIFSRKADGYEICFADQNRKEKPADTSSKEGSGGEKK